jgi:glycosyltransferase involved in cell wall biosynthesis
LNRSILIVAHRYLPYKGVNGVRWINLSRILAKKGYDITVVTVSRKGLDQTDLSQGVGIKTIVTKSDPYYRLVEYQPANIFQKLLKYCMTRVFSTIYRDDYAQYWNHGLEKHIKSFSKRHPEGVVIATGAPFQACYHASNLAKKYSLKTIIDFQDPWAGDALGRASNKLEEYRVKSHLQIVGQSTYRVYVTNGLLKHYGDLNVDNAKVIENAHSFKLESLIDTARLRTVKVMDWLYVGTLANGRDDALIEWLEHKSMHSKMSNSNIRLDVFGRVSEKFKRYINSNSMNKGVKIRLCGSVDQKEIPSLSLKYGVGLQINAKAYPYLVSTKIYEYPALSLPTVSINYGGEIECLIKSCKLGLSVNLREKVFPLAYLIQELKELDAMRLEDAKESFSWEARALQFEALLSEIYNKNAQ